MNNNRSVTVTKVVKNTVVVDHGRLNAVASAGSANYVHTQHAPASEWVVNHGLQYKPSVTVVSNSGEVLIGDVTFNGDYQIIIRFSAPFAGKVYLS